ncbi:dethiobiotin synthase [Peptoclostridium litorale]|uniref:dethiobiotin synthase n=1 Tax=Peptoclostridium litorale TaxID=1557 RepID=UPI000571C693|nr:dethiobiotin synthase [Peptoclostridium litorale]
MNRGIFITGTDTGVGKTFITAGITYILNKSGVSSCSFKPVESGGRRGKEAFLSNDSIFVKQVCGLDEDVENMNTHCLENEMSPHIAFELEGQDVKVSDIKRDYMALCSKYERVVVEGCGGIAVPIKRDCFYVDDLIKELELPCIIVARASLGTINHTILTVEYARSRGVDIRGIIINGYEGGTIQDDNIKTIESATGIYVISKVSKCSEMEDADCMRDVFEKCIDFERLKMALEWE